MALDFSREQSLHESGVESATFYLLLFQLILLVPLPNKLTSRLVQIECQRLAHGYAKLSNNDQVQAVEFVLS